MWGWHMIVRVSRAATGKVRATRERRMPTPSGRIIARTYLRAEALRFLIHFVGDIHQPLHHAADNGDRGGNEVGILLGGRRTNLYAVWVTTLVQSLGGDAETVAGNLMARITPADRRK